LERKIAVFLGTLFTFLIWLFLAIYFSDENDWWTVIQVEQTSYDTSAGTVSSTRVLIGSSIFIFIGLLVNKVIKKIYGNQ
jgi:hypothetical protein